MGLVAVQPALFFAVSYDEIGPASPWRSPSRRTPMRALWAPTFILTGAIVTAATFDRFTWPAIWCFTAALCWLGELVCERV